MRRCYSYYARYHEGKAVISYYCKVPEDRSPFESTLKIHEGKYFILYWNEACVRFLEVIQT